jgi:hypothetical protein
MSQDDWSDKDVTAAFLKMVLTLALWVFWMIFNIFWGIVKDLAFFDNALIPLWEHIVFFIWLVGTLPVMIWLTVVKIWKL